jgi:hypothetical protein
MSANTVKAKVPATQGAQKTAKKVEAAPQPTVPVSWVGIDRQNMPLSPTTNKSGWMGALIDNSNLRLTGAYLTGAATPKSDYTSSSRDSDRHWVENIGALRDQGWGIAFWYVGYSVGGGHPIPAALKLDATAAAARGVAHAKHAKGIVGAMNPPLAGAIVFLDNEDDISKIGSKLDPIRAYYKAFFDELEDSADGPALRCGLYAHSEVAAEFVKDRVDLFQWQVRLDNATLEPKRDENDVIVKDDKGKTVYTATTKEPPFQTTANPLFIDPVAPSAASPQHVRSNRNIKSFPIQVSNTDIWTAWPVGRQFRYYIGDMPTAAWVTAHSNTAPLLTAVNSFDYDTSLVRDPCYPVAEPRIAAAAGDIVVAGTFVRTAGGASDPTMKVEALESSGRVAVAAAANCVVEPDAPIAVATTAGADTQFMTVRPTGELAAFSRSSAGVWSAIDPIAFTAAPRLRRLRALALVAFAAQPPELHAFYAGDDHQLYTSRRQGTAPWDDPAVTGSPLALHPFTALAATSRAGLSVDVFALDSQGLLNACSWSPVPSPAQGTWRHLVLDTAGPSPVPSLLKSGALAATSPDPQKLFVFGIRRDLRLGYWEWTGPDGGWSEPIPVSGTTARLSPHSRLAAHSYSGVVEVAALSHDGTLRLYQLTLGGTTWTAQTPIPFDNPDDVAPAGYVVPPPASPTEEAYGWSINPFGDLAIVRETNGTVVYAAGIAAGRNGLLSLNLTVAGSTWQLHR